MVELKKRLSVILESPQDTNVKLLKICQLLDKEIDYYNWTGFYFKNGDKDELALGPYVGAVTDHVIIPFWRDFRSAGCSFSG